MQKLYHKQTEKYLHSEIQKLFTTKRSCIIKVNQIILKELHSSECRGLYEISRECTCVDSFAYRYNCPPRSTLVGVAMLEQTSGQNPRWIRVNVWRQTLPAGNLSLWHLTHGATLNLWALKMNDDNINWFGSKLEAANT